MYFTGTKVLSNDLKETGDMVIFVLYKIIHSFMYANVLVIE